MEKKEWAKELNDTLSQLGALERIKYIGENFSQQTTFSTSLGIEDQVITQMLSEFAPKVAIFTLDTGRLFPETYQLLEETIKAFNIDIKVYFPDHHKVEAMVNEKGINLFYRSIENRKLCCGIRKTESLRKALQGFGYWITGIRKDQSVTRFFNQYAEWSETDQLIKLNPLLDWSEKDTWNYIKQNKIPYNPLHDQGFPSIGCQPCTRAVQKGEDVRSGRWWWEEPEHKECGLHNQTR
jgi:phosphoadenosine phosphosulfate reductase